VPPAAVSLSVAPYDFAVAERLADSLGVSHVVAQVLVRRGFEAPDAARAFLDAAVRHPLGAFGGLRAGAQLILDHVRRGSRITIHGDYDVDGVCSTAITIRVLRTLGADVDWYLPSRTEDGYGLAAHTVERLARRGTDLLVCVDCAITAVDEVAAARAAGMDVVVCDHHHPREDGALPDAAIVHPALGGYPCPELCAAGVAHLLARALLEADGRDPEAADADLDLVALATVADVVPLRDENRRLVREGLRALASTRKAGLQALMEIARVDPSAVDAGAVGFRLAPRINAAGRLRRADAGLELVLANDVGRARAVAAELDAVNAERRDVESRILFEAEAQVAAQRAAAAEHGEGEPIAYVLAGEGWHPGVIGIVASRVAERHHRPAVLIALDGEQGTGSGRSIPGFDLLAGLHAGARHLLRHGGHRAAAGLTIERGEVDAFRAAFTAHAADVLTAEDLTPRQRVDAVVPGDALHIGLAEELERLAPFGMGNPAPVLLVPAARLADPQAMGEGRHVRFTLSAGGSRAKCVAFGQGASLPAPAGEPVDAAVRLEVNRFRGSVEPRLVLRHAQPAAGRSIELLGELPFFEALGAELLAPLDVAPWPTAPCDRLLRDARGVGIAGLLGDLVASGASVLAVAAHAEHRHRGLAPRVGGFALTSWTALERDPELTTRFDHVVAIDPPAAPHVHAGLAALPGAGWIHLAWGEAEAELAARVLAWEYDLRDAVADAYRELRAAGDARGDRLAAALRGRAQPGRSGAVAGRVLRVLHELGLAHVDLEALAVAIPPPAGRTALERSAAFRAYARRHAEGVAQLAAGRIPAADRERTLVAA
jgi:single-stranded-DNA-specific exonuclease